MPVRSVTSVGAENLDRAATADRPGHLLGRRPPDIREVQLLVGTAIGITRVVQVRTARREIDTTTPVAEDRVAGEGVEVAVFGGDKDANWVIRDRVVTYAVAVRVTT